MYRLVYFEISEVCNAKCPWCQTGLASMEGKPQKGRFIDPDVFANAVRHLRRNGLIDNQSVLHLYNWGEPFLHPEIQTIVAFLDGIGQPFAFSTNASKAVVFEENVLNHLVNIRFSLPGFSQDSYSRIHGFRFKKILCNIEKILANFRKKGFRGESEVNFHIYRFNKHEIDPAIEYATRIGIDRFIAYHAFPAGYEMFKDHLRSSMPKAQSSRAQQDLDLHVIDQFKNSCPDDYSCPQFDLLVIDSRCNILTCCVLDQTSPSYSIGSLFDTNKGVIRENKVSQSVCSECSQLGIHFLTNNPIIKIDRLLTGDGSSSHQNG